MLLLETDVDQSEEREPGPPPPPADVAAMSWVRRRYRDISPVTLQVVGGAMSSSLYCGEVEGLVGGAVPLVDSFLVELYRCKLCHYTCGLRTAITSHVLLRHRPPSLTYLGGAEEGGREEASEEVGLQQVASPYRLELSGESKQSDEDEDFLLYNMLDNMSPPTCDISSEGGLQVAHTCEVSTLFEEGGGEGVDLSMCPPSSQEEMAQSAHLMTLGLCRISAPRAPPPAPPPPPAAATSPRPVQPHATPADPLRPPTLQRRSSQMRSGQKLACVLCPVALASRRLLDVHLRSHQVGGGFSCVHCGWTSSGWDELETHWTRRCRRKKRRKRRRREETELQGTGGNTTLGQDPIGRAVQEEAGLTHSQSRTAEGGDRKTKTVRRRKEAEPTGFCCSLCHRKFSSKLTLRRHRGVHGGDKPFACQHCPYRSRLKASLLQHLRTHTGERPHQCPQCSYASIDRSSLLRHCRTHSQEKPYQCELCDYSSIQKKSLDLHARRHHTGEVFPCQQCQYSSPDRQLLMRHVRRHHHATATQPS